MVLHYFRSICTGENFKKFPDLVQLIKNNWHAFGNHSYSHMNGLKVDSKTYIEDVNKAKELIQSNLFRPPWGALSLRKFAKIRSDNKIIMWSISSNDEKDYKHWDNYCQKMVKQTKPGSIILFHFSNKHANRTKQIFPIYLDEVSKLGYKCDSIIS